MEKEVGERKQRLSELTVIENNMLSADVALFFLITTTSPSTKNLSYSGDSLWVRTLLLY